MSARMPEGMRSPCGTCPFSRTCQPGHTGGSPPEVFIGQGNGPFHLMCHSCYEEGVHAKDQDPMKVRQCAGMAIMRANEGLSDKLPPRLHRLPPDTEKVFASWAEFFAHHYGIDLKVAKAVLRNCPPDMFTERELSKREVKLHLIPTA